METLEEDKEAFASFLAKGIKIHEKVLGRLESRTEELAIAASDVENLDPEKVQEFLFAIAVLIQNNPKSITRLSIRGIPIPTSLMNTYSVALQLTLSECSINDEGLLALCIGLQSNLKIKFLDLSGNSITSNGFECLVDCLEYGLPLAELWLVHNQIEEFSVGSAFKENTTLQVLDVSYNKLDAKGIWEVLEAVKYNPSIKELHLTQEEKVAGQKLLYQLCEVFLNNKSLKKLYLEIDVPDHVTDKLATALKANLDLILWEPLGNPKLGKYIEANKIIQESIEQNIEVDVEDNDAALKEVLMHKLKAIGVRYKIMGEGIRKKGPMDTIKELTAEERTEENVKQVEEDNKEIKEWGLKDLKEAMNGKVEVAELAKILVGVLSNMEERLQVKEDIKPPSIKEMEGKLHELEAKVSALEEQNKELTGKLQQAIEARIAHLEEGIEKTIGKLENSITAAQSNNKTDKRIQSLEKDLVSYKQSSDTIYNEYNNKLNMLGKIQKSTQTDVDEMGKKLARLEQSFDMLNKPITKAKVKSASEATSEELWTEMESFKQKQIFFQHKLRELETSIDESNKLHKLSMENLTLQLKNVELSKSMSMLEKRKTSKSTTGKYATNALAESYLSRKREAIESPVEIQARKTFHPSESPSKRLDESISQKNPITEPNNKSLLRISSSPTLRLSPSQASPIISGPSKELLEFLKNKGFQFAT